MLASQEFRGLWHRSLLATPEGVRDMGTQVRWLQGPSLFVDLRQPAGLAARLSGACRLDALTAADCLALAEQQGFAGRFEARDGAFEWVRRLDFQPPPALPDLGRLFWRDAILVEEGVVQAYTEHWHREPGSDEAACGFWLRDPEHGIEGCLLRAGDWFGYMRGRPEALPGASLTVLVEAASTLVAMQELINCEISLGKVSAGWRIERSSLPYRVGCRMEMRPKGERLEVLEPDAAARPTTRHWEILHQEGDVSMILNAISQLADRARPLNGF